MRYDCIGVEEIFQAIVAGLYEVCICDRNVMYFLAMHLEFNQSMIMEERIEDEGFIFDLTEFGEEAFCKCKEN